MAQRAPALQLRTTICDSIVRRISLAGLASQKEALAAIKRGEVEIDGKTVTKNVQVCSEASIRCRGQEVPMDSPTRLWGVVKPQHVVCSLSSVPRAVTLRDFINARSSDHQRLEGKFPLYLPPFANIVRSLDSGVKGLVLLTNDASFSRRLADPKSRIQTVYKIKVFGIMPSDELQSIRNGVVVNNVDYGPVWVELFKRNFRSTWMRLRLIEDSRRCLDTLMEFFKLKILKIERVAFGPIRVNDLPNTGDLMPLPIPSCFRQFIAKPKREFCMLPTSETLLDVGELPSIFDALKRRSAVKALED